MDNDLLTVARTLAQRGWLPGIEISGNRLDEDGLLLMFPNRDVMAELTEADLFFAAHNEIVRRGWVVEINKNEVIIDTGNTWGNTHAPGTTTLSLLKCLLRACEANEVSSEASKEMTNVD